MSRNIYDPQPAEVRQYEEAYGAIMKKVGVLNSEIARNDKMNIQRFLEMGRLMLRARPLANNDWEETLKEHNVSHQRASDAMWGASQPPEEQTKWESIADLRRARDEKSGQEVSGTAQKGSAGQDESTSDAPAKPWPDNNRCRDCRTTGKNDPKCKACKALNPSPEEPAEEEVAPEEPTVNGAAEGWKFCKLCNEQGYARGCLMCRLMNGRDMTAEEQAEHAPDPEAPKPPPSLIKKLEKAYSALWGVYRAIGRQFGLAVGKSVIDPDNHPSMKAMIEAHAALKERTKRFIWEHQKKRQQQDKGQKQQHK